MQWKEPLLYFFIRRVIKPTVAVNYQGASILPATSILHPTFFCKGQLHTLPKLLDTSIKDFDVIRTLITDQIFIICQVPRKNVNKIQQYIMRLHT